MAIKTDNDWVSIPRGRGWRRIPFEVPVTGTFNDAWDLLKKMDGWLRKDEAKFLWGVTGNTAIELGS